MNGQNGKIYQFGEFRLIPAEQLLLRGDEPVPMTPKVFATLIVLVEQNGHLVEKKELLHRVWNNAFVEEANVARSIWTLRKALGEDKHNPEFIKTIPKRGYRFVADVQLVNRVEPFCDVSAVIQVKTESLSARLPLVEVTPPQNVEAVSKTLDVPIDKSDLKTPPLEKLRIVLRLLFTVISLFGVIILIGLLTFILL